MIVGAVVILFGAGIAAKGMHDAAIGRVKDEAREEGRVAEETKWKLAAAAVADRNRVERQQDQAKIRDIGVALGDARMALREQRDDFDRAMLEAENADAADGARNMFDPRVVRGLNAKRRPRGDPGGGG